MKKTIKRIIISFSILAASNCFGQSVSKQNVNDSSILWSKYIDSTLNATSVKEFQNFLINTVTVKFYNEGSFQEFMQLFIEKQYQIWISRKSNKR